MGFSISDFSAQFKVDFARQYQFNLSWAQKIPSLRNMSVFIESTELPSRDITIVEAGYMGQDYKIAGMVKFPDWVCTFRVDSKYRIYEALRIWQEQIDFNSSNMEDIRGYKGDIQLDQIDGHNNTVGIVILYGAFPKTIGAIKYDTKSSELVTLEVTFSYDYHKWQSTRIKPKESKA